MYTHSLPWGSSGTRWPFIALEMIKWQIYIWEKKQKQKRPKNKYCILHSTFYFLDDIVNHSTFGPGLPGKPSVPRSPLVPCEVIIYGCQKTSGSDTDRYSMKIWVNANQGVTNHCTISSRQTIQTVFSRKTLQKSHIKRVNKYTIKS